MGSTLRCDAGRMDSDLVVWKVPCPALQDIIKLRQRLQHSSKGSPDPLTGGNTNVLSDLEDTTRSDGLST